MYDFFCFAPEFFQYLIATVLHRPTIGSLPKPAKPFAGSLPRLALTEASPGGGPDVSPEASEVQKEFWVKNFQESKAGIPAFPVLN